MAFSKVFPKASASFAACLVIGLTLNNVWFNLVGYSPAFSSGLDFSSASSLGRLGFMAACIVSSLLFGALERPLKAARQIVALLIPALLFMGTGMFGLAGSQSLMEPHLLVFAGSVLMGLGYSWNVLCFYSLQASRGSSWQVIVILVISGALTATTRAIIVDAVDVSSQILIATCLAIAIPLCLYAASSIAKRAGTDAGTGFPFRFRKNGEFTRLEPADIEEASSRSFLKNRGQVLLLALVTVTMIALRGLGEGGIWGADRADGASSAASRALGLGLYAVLSLATFWVYLNHKEKQRYHLPFLVLIAGFMLLVALGEAPASGLLSQVLVPALTMAIELFCQAIFSFTVINGIRTLPYSPMRVAGFTLALSWLLAALWMLLFEHTGPTASLVILMVSYLLIVFVAVPDKQEARSDDGDPFGAVIARSRALAKENGLTNREADILDLLAQGRSVPYMCQELTLAEGTVRTHMMRIYKKLDVHSKQELLDMLAGKER